MRREVDCIEGGSFRPSRFGARRCFYRLGVGWRVPKIEMVLRCVARRTASREAPVGRRVSECVVAFTAWGIGWWVYLKGVCLPQEDDDNFKRG